MFASANAGADGGEANSVAGRNRTRRGGKDVGLQEHFGSAGGSDSSGAEVNELAARQGILSHEFYALTKFQVFP
jgi:hypothetical protein